MHKQGQKGIQFCTGQKHQAPEVQLTHCKNPPVYYPMWLPAQDAHMGGNRSLMGINREMRRGKRGIFSSNVTRQISYCCLQCGMQLPDVPLQHLSRLLLLHFSFHTPLQSRALPCLAAALRSSLRRLLFEVPQCQGTRRASGEAEP